MKSCSDNAFDLAIVDPPYGHGNKTIKNGNTRSKIAAAGQHKHYDNSQSPPPEYFEELKRVSKNQIIWGANHFCDKFDASGAGWIVWDKQTDAAFADCELAYSSFDRALKRFTFMWSGMHQGGYGGDTRLNETRIHPSQKPVKLYDWLLHNYAEPGQMVLDTHLGSGSSAIAAHYFGVDFVGLELDPDYYKATVDRVHRETLQQSFF